MKTLSVEEKERIINLATNAVRSGLANGDYLDIEENIKSLMRAHLQTETFEDQVRIVHEFIAYLRHRMQMPGGRLGIIALIKMGKIKRVPQFLLDCATAVWGTFLKNKANSGKLRELFMG